MTKQAHKTKQTLRSNKQYFKELKTKADNIQLHIKRQLYKQINALDKDEETRQKKQQQIKRKLALKQHFEPYTVQKLKDQEQVPVDGDLRAGTMVFMKNCSTCHTLEALDAAEKRGPPLGLIFNRRAGSHTLFTLYSSNLLSASFYWTARNLYCFMSSPTSLLKSSNCHLQKSPLTNDSDRADLIALFRQFTKEMSFNVRLKEIQRIGYTAYQTELHYQRQQQTRGLIRQKTDAKRERKI